ncbi:MAG TPA: DUF512 domain-containing protein, partial [bacterium]|nr:DUF512 domain-containing protein [bacterium]
KLKTISDNSIFRKYNINIDDYLLAINNNKIDDILDYYFYLTTDRKKIKFSFQKSVDNKIVNCYIVNSDYFNAGIDFYDFKVLRCGNNCVFCFCDQHPKTARATLFFKDEDYRLSFLYGNYITLTNLKDRDYEKIMKLKLSPLYISVHSTNDEIRRRMLGANYKFKILDKLRFFAKNKINMHTQIVLIPNYNFDDLENTINDLLQLYPNILSIAVVPVGLTKYRKNLTPLKKINKFQALKVLRIVEKYQKYCFEKFGKYIVYASDEFYFLTNTALPDYSIYGEFEQLENGVGMASKFNYEFHKKIKRYSKKFNRENHYAIITGKMVENFFYNISQILNNEYKMNVSVISVSNQYFGKSVNVAGLLAGADINRTLKKLYSEKKITDNTIILLPANTLQYNSDLFIDGFKMEQFPKNLNIKIIEPTAQTLLKTLTK